MDTSIRQFRLLLLVAIGAVYCLTCKNAYACENNDLTEKIKSADSFEDIFGNGERIELKTPPDKYILSAREVKISPDQRIYIVDFKSHCVHVFDAAGLWIRTFGRQGPGPEEFRNPNSIAIGKDGRIYVSDPRNRRIAVWDTSGHLSKTILLGGASHAIELMDENRIIVLSMEKNLFDIYDTDGAFLKGLGDWWDLIHNYYRRYRIPIMGGSFSVDQANRVYFVYVGKYEVRKYDLTRSLIKKFERRADFYREPPEPPITTENALGFKKLTL